MGKYETIILEPYSGDAEWEALALAETLPINVYFDDICNYDTCRFCYTENEFTPTVDYEVEIDELTRWYNGEISIELHELPHDKDMWAEMVYWSDSRQEWISEEEHEQAIIAKGGAA